MSAFGSGRASAVLVAIVLAAATLALFGWVLTLGFTTKEPFQDFRFHNQLAAQMAAGAPLELPHPLYHILLAALHAIVPGLGLFAAGLAVVLSAEVALALLAYADLRGVLERAAERRTVGWVAGAAAAGVALAVTLVAPINALTPASREFYFGYLFPNAFHSPTVIVLRPLAVGLFLACARTLARTAPRRTATDISGIALLTISCALAKPSYLICLLPALILLFLLERGGGLGGRWWPLALGVLLPGALVVGMQAWFTLTSPQMEPSSVIVAPFKVVFLYTRDDVGLVAFKLLMSILFPVSAALAFPSAALRDSGLRLAWLGFLLGAVYAYGLAESGPRLEHGNFLWSGQVAVLVLFMASARFLAARLPEMRTTGAHARLAVCAAVFGLHLASGLAYAVHFARTGRGF